MNLHSTYYFHKFQENQHNKANHNLTSFFDINLTETPLVNKSQSPNLLRNRSQFQMTNQTSTDPFPFLDIINLNIEQILANGNISLIESYIPKMLFHKFKTTSNLSLVQILSSFQIILNYLFQLKGDIDFSNNKLENLINNKSSWINQQILAKEKTIKDNYSLIQSVNYHKKEMKAKIQLYKSVLYSNNFQKILPHSGPLKIKQFNTFFCDLCSEKKFFSFEEVQIHYIKTHFNQSSIYNCLQSNESFQKLYFDNKLNIMKKDLIKSFSSIQQNKSKTEPQDEIKQAFQFAQGEERNLQNNSVSQISELKQSVTINHYLQNNKASLKTNTNYIKPSIELKSMSNYFNDFEKQHEENIRNLLNEMKLFKQEVFKKLNEIKTIQNGQEAFLKNQNSIHNNVLKHCQPDSFKNENFNDYDDQNELNKITNTQTELSKIKKEKEIILIKHTDQFKVESQKTQVQDVNNNLILSRPILSAKHNTDILTCFYNKYIKREKDFIANKAIHENVQNYNIFKFTISENMKVIINQNINKECEEKDFLTTNTPDKLLLCSIINNILKKNQNILNNYNKNDSYYFPYSIIDFENSVNSLSVNLQKVIYSGLDKQKLF